MKIKAGIFLGYKSSCEIFSKEEMGVQYASE